MTARVLDGKRIADEVLNGIAARVRARVTRGQRRPGLAVVLVGQDPASAVYVRNKRRACERVGFVTKDFDLPATIDGAELYALIDQLNADPEVDGILVGRLALRQPGLRPCTPKGIMTLLAHTDKPVRGRHAVIVGVSNHVGRPLLLEYLLAGATVTACHRFTPDLPEQVAVG